MKHADGVFPTALVDQVVPIRNDITHWAAGVAKGNAAIHAARGLRLNAGVSKRLVDLEEIVEAIGDRTPRRHLARVFFEASYLAHR